MRDVGDPTAQPDVLDVHVVSHTHWDREWYLTREQFRLRLVDLIDRLLDLLDAEPRFLAFHLDGQTIVLEDYLEVRPEQEERLRRRIAEGRILVGPWYVMPDEFLVSGEALVRNLALGHRIAGRFGPVMAVGYVPDPFGHVAQLPQILARFGLASAVLWRGFSGPKAEYVWEAPDGSRVLLLHLPREGYCNGLRLPLLPEPAMRQRAAALLERERERTAFGQVLLLVGVDHVEPHPSLPDLVARLGERPSVRARLSTLPAYVEAVRSAAASRADPLETVRGELRSGQEHAFLLPGVLSTRSYLKQANARVQTMLEEWAEPLALFAWLAGSDHPAGVLGYAWRTLLQNHPHDSICGCSIDAVHEENLTRYARALQAAEGVAERSLAFLARQVEPPPAGALRCLVVNTDAAPHAGVVETLVDLPFESAESARVVATDLLESPLTFFPRDGSVVSVTDPEGRPVAFQPLDEEPRVIHLMSRFEPPWAVRARRLRLALWAEAPAFGYAALDLRVADPAVPRDTPIPPARAVSAGERWMENEHLRVEVNGDGTLEVRDKRSGTVYSRCGELEDTGDVGDEYTYCPPARDRRLASRDARSVAVRALAAGPLRASLLVELELPVAASATADRAGRSEEVVALPVSLRVTLDAGSQRVVWTATVDNRARDHRLRVLFPTGAAVVETARADTAFGVVARPARRPVPATPLLEVPVSAAPLQSFVDAGDGSRGVTVLSEGLMEYEVLPGDPARVGLTLLRCVGDLSRDDLATRRGHAGPALATPGAQCLGRHTFRFAMEPRASPRSEEALFASARSFLAPAPLAGPAGRDGSLPTRLSFLGLETEGGAVVLSACKKAEERDSIVLRLFAPGERDARVRIGSRSPIDGAFALDLLERRLQELPVEEGRVVVRLGPYRIETVELVPRGAAARRGEDA